MTAPSTLEDRFTLLTPAGEQPFAVDSLQPQSDLLTGATVAVLARFGFDLPVQELNEQAAAGQAGSSPTGPPTLLPRDVGLQVLVDADDPIRYRLFKQQLQTTLRQATALKISTPLGVRVLNCVYTGGWEGSQSPDTVGSTWEAPTLTFHAFDPYFYAEQATERLYRVAPSSFFPARFKTGAPFAPINIVTADTVLNVGSEPAEPVWTLRGPAGATSLRLYPDTAVEQALVWTGSVAAGSSVVFDTRAGRKTIRFDDGTSAFRYLAAPRRLWQLPAGSSSFDVQVTNAGPGSSLALSYQPRYSTLGI